jgi:hypothetical protein
MKLTVWTIGAFLLGTSLAIVGCKGKEGPAGAPGTGYTPPAALCTNPTQQGNTATTFNASKTGGRIAASRVVVSTATTAINLAIYIPAGPVTGQIRLGLYNDTGANYPNLLIAETNPFFPALNSWNTVDINDVYIPAATYWIAELYSTTNTSMVGAYVGSGTWVYSGGYGWSMLPAAFPGAGSTSTFPSSVYMNTCP